MMKYLLPLKHGLLKTWEFLEQKWYWLFPLMLLDTLFFFSGGIIIAFLEPWIFDEVLGMMNFLQTSGLSSAQNLGEQSMLEAAKAYPVFLTHYYAFLKLLLFAYVLMFIAYVVFQGLSWYVAYKVSGKKVDFFFFAKRFFYLTGFWFLIFGAGLAASMQFLFYNKTSIIPLVSDFVVAIVEIALLLVLAHFVLVSYSLLPLKKPLRSSFVSGVKTVLSWIPVYAVIAALFTILHFFLKVVYDINITAERAVGLVLFLVLLALARVLILFSSEKMQVY